MKSTPTYDGNIPTSALQDLPDGTLFYEHKFDGLAPETEIFKKMETLPACKDWQCGDVVIQKMTCGQYSEVPGERCRLGWTDDSEKEWRVLSDENVQRIIGWLMTSHQMLNQ